MVDTNVMIHSLKQPMKEEKIDKFPCLSQTQANQGQWQQEALKEAYDFL
jgi:hypothetical protein